MSVYQIIGGELLHPRVELVRVFRWDLDCIFLSFSRVLQSLQKGLIVVLLCEKSVSADSELYDRAMIMATTLTSLTEMSGCFTVVDSHDKAEQLWGNYRADILDKGLPAMGRVLSVDSNLNEMVIDNFTVLPKLAALRSWGDYSV